MTDRTPTIVGVGLSDYPKAPHLSVRQHHAQALRRALDDSGLSIRDIDGLMADSMGSGGNGQVRALDLAEYFGIRYKVIGGVGVGGAMFEFMMQQACAQIRDGQCDVVAITFGSDLLTSSGRSLGTGHVPGRGVTVIENATQFEMPYGQTIVSSYAMAAKRHMHEFGTTSAQLAEIAVAARRYAQLNPNALYRKPLSVEDVLKSRMVADPLHMLDCCVISDGGGAVIVTTAERAKDLKAQPIYVLGTGSAQTHWNVGQMPDFTRTAAVDAGKRAFAEAGVRPEDIDTVQLYDSFTITVMLLLEDLGFCPKGEGGRFVEGGRLAPGGSLPCNTDGGGLSSSHPGMRGIFLMIEAVRQLRGQAGEAQVADCKLALACGSGGYLSGMSAVIMGTEHPQ